MIPLSWESLNGVRAKAQAAQSITLIGAVAEETLNGVMIYLDREAGLVHVLDHAGETHLFTAPVGRTIIEWHASSERGGARIASSSPQTAA